MLVTTRARLVVGEAKPCARENSAPGSVLASASAPRRRRDWAAAGAAPLPQESAPAIWTTGEACAGPRFRVLPRTKRTCFAAPTPWSKAGAEASGRSSPDQEARERASTRMPVAGMAGVNARSKANNTFSPGRSCPLRTCTPTQRGPSTGSMVMDRPPVLVLVKRA